MKTFYLAARYSRREELLEYRKQLNERGFLVTSRWLEGNHELDVNGLSVEASARTRTQFAVEDREDVEAADIVISFTEPARSTNSRGGRHVEFGMAIAWNKALVVIGPRENVFHHLPGIQQYNEWIDFLKNLDLILAVNQ